MVRRGTGSAKKRFLYRLYDNYVERQDVHILAELKTGELVKPKLTLGILWAYILAILIHSITIFVLLAGIIVLVYNLIGILSFCVGPWLILMAWVLCPRIGKAPPGVLPKASFPNLYRFVDEVADELGASPVDIVALTPYRNASFGRYGLRQSRVVAIGYPLWEQLENQERVGLIAHELAHELNGDVSRGFLVGTAIVTLIRWWGLLQPPFTYRRPTGGEVIGAILWDVVTWILFQILSLLIFAMSRSLLQQSRQAEYLADRLGASISGTESFISLLKKLEAYEFKGLSVLASTHPPANQRIELLKSKPALQASIVLTSKDSSEIDQELSVSGKRIVKLNY